VELFLLLLLCYKYVSMVHISFWFMLITLVGRRRTYYIGNTEALVFANKENGLEVNANKTKYMGMSRDQNSV